MSDMVFLRGVVLDVHVGVSDDERAVAQPIELDIELALDLTRAGQSDDLAATADYGAVYGACRELVTERRFKLLEAIAQAVATDVLGRFGNVEAVAVTATKLAVPIDGEIDRAGVRIERRRDRGPA